MMKYIKSINEGWIDKDWLTKVLPTRPLPLWKMIKNASEEIFPKYLLGVSHILDKYIDKIEVDSFDNEEDNKCYLIIKTNIPIEDDLTENRLFVIYTKKGVICFDGFKDAKPINMSYPLDKEEDIEEIITLFAKRLKQYLEDVFELDNSL